MYRTAKLVLLSVIAAAVAAVVWVPTGKVSVDASGQAWVDFTELSMDLSWRYVGQGPGPSEPKYDPRPPVIAWRIVALELVAIAALGALVTGRLYARSGQSPGHHKGEVIAMIGGLVLLLVGTLTVVPAREYSLLGRPVVVNDDRVFASLRREAESSLPTRYQFVWEDAWRLIADPEERDGWCLIATGHLIHWPILLLEELLIIVIGTLRIRRRVRGGSMGTT